MFLDFAIWIAAAWMLYMSFAMSTGNTMSMLFFKLFPFLSSVTLLVGWSMEHGYIINIGG